MQVRVSVRHTDIPGNMKEYIEKKSAKFQRYFERIQEVHVIVEQVKFSYVVEFILKSDLFSIQAKETGSDLRTLVDKVVHIMERKVKREKDKIVKDKKHSRDSLRRTEEI